MIDKEKFLAYEKVRKSGKTNMFAVDVVCDLSGLTREEVMMIIENYGDLKKLYLKGGEE